MAPTYEISQELANNSLLADAEMPFRGIYYPLGFAVVIHTNDPSVLEAANESWGHLHLRRRSGVVQIQIGVTEGTSPECPPAPTVRIHRHLVSMVSNSENHAICDLNAGLGFAWITRAVVKNRLYLRYHVIESMALIMLANSFAPALHAACVSHHGRGMLFCGESGAGKSTLAYACARVGFTYTSDDASYLLRDADHPRVAGNAHTLRFRPPTRDLFPELRGRELTPRAAGKPSIEIPTSDFPNLITADEAPIHYVILLRRKAHAEARLVPVSTESALQSLHANLYPTEEIRNIQIAALEQLATTQAFEFYYSDLDEAVRCLDLLARSPEPSA